MHDDEFGTMGAYKEYEDSPVPVFLLLLLIACFLVGFGVMIGWVAWA
jgi:hypothetical protein